MNVLPNMETVFPPHEQERVLSQGIRYQIAMEDVRDLLDEHIRGYLSPEISESWGEKDTSRNALAAIGHQLATPGHYGRSPLVLGVDAERLNAAVSGLWPAKQFIEYLAYTCGSVAQRLEVDDDGDLVLVVVPAHLCWAESGANPKKPVLIRELRVVEVVTAEQGRTHAYAWREWDIRDPANPVCRWVEAKANGKLGEDLTPQLGAIEYVWKTPEGKPYLPWVIDRSFDVGDLWNHKRGRGTARGTLTGMMLTSAATAIALRSTGKVALVFDARPLGQTVQSSGGVATISLEAQPGAIVFLERLKAENQPSVSEIGEVDTLGVVAQYAKDYGAQLAQDMGISPSDVVRTGANPASGAALQITNEGKRQEQRRRGEIARQADLHMLRCAAWLKGLSIEGLGVQYYELELSTTEMEAKARTDQAELAMGIVSQVDVLMSRRPGLTREQALEHLRRVRQDEAEVGTKPDTGVQA